MDGFFKEYNTTRGPTMAAQFVEEAGIDFPGIKEDADGRLYIMVLGDRHYIVPGEWVISHSNDYLVLSDEAFQEILI